MEDNISEFELIEPSEVEIRWAVINMITGGLILFIGLLIMLLGFFEIIEIDNGYASVLGAQTFLGSCLLFIGFFLGRPEYRHKE